MVGAGTTGHRPLHGGTRAVNRKGSEKPHCRADRLAMI
jgi:hypothetical protein